MTLPSDDKKPLEQEANSALEQKHSRRDFIKKYGKLAAITPVALSLAMQSQAQTSEGGGDGGPPPPAPPF